MHLIRRHNALKNELPSKESLIVDENVSPPGKDKKTSKILHRCKICHLIFNDYLNLVGHAALEHFKERIIEKYSNPKNECWLCKKALHNETNLIVHLARSHNTVKASEFAEAVEGSADSSDSSSNSSDETDMSDVIKAKKRPAESDDKEPPIKMHKKHF